jgi:hypothetical protein
VRLRRAVRKESCCSKRVVLFKALLFQVRKPVRQRHGKKSQAGLTAYALIVAVGQGTRNSRTPE